MNEIFALIDTETNWSDEVMSIGMIIAEDNTYAVKKEYYGLISPECYSGGMFSSVLRDNKAKIDNESTREQIIKEVKSILCKYNVHYIFAYNSSFDENHLPELSDYLWVDIMKTTMYRQYNPFIPKYIDTCKTGKIMSSYGVESMLHMITGKFQNEVHNALCDTRDELFIMKSLNMSIVHFVENNNKTSGQRIKEYKDFIDI